LLLAKALITQHFQRSSTSLVVSQLCEEKKFDHTTNSNCSDVKTRRRRFLACPIVIPGFAIWRKRKNNNKITVKLRTRQRLIVILLFVCGGQVAATEGCLPHHFNFPESRRLKLFEQYELPFVAAVHELIFRIKWDPPKNAQLCSRALVVKLSRALITWRHKTIFKQCAERYLCWSHKDGEGSRFEKDSQGKEICKARSDMTGQAICYKYSFWTIFLPNIPHPCLCSRVQVNRY
jgi:hypothetical protein